MKAIKLSIIVQASHEKNIRETLAKLGTGTIGNYTNCQFVTRGEAQFESSKEANPAIGQRGQVSLVEAVQIQTWCKEEQVDEVVRALKEAHPNEEPGIEIIPFEMR